jgi:hypothetical protein
MKSIKDLRESHNLIIEKEEHDMNKLTQLVRAGLFDAKKLSALKRAMDKPADKMTAQEKRMMINLLDALMAEVLSDKQVYRKIKQDVMKEAREIKDYYSGPDPRVQRVGYPSNKTEAPSVLLLKRKAIRVFPDGQKVALYYAQAIDKYVSIPYNEIGINEEVELEEGIGGAIVKGVVAAGKAISRMKVGRKVAKVEKQAVKDRKSAAIERLVQKKYDKKNPFNKAGRLKNKGGKGGKGGKLGTAAAAAAGAAAGSGSGDSGASGGSEPKYFTPMSSKIQANISGPKKEGGADARSERERQASLKASKAVTNESVNLDGNIFELNNTTATKITSLYESLNKKNKKKMIEMMKESDESFNKVISFAVRQ